MMGSPYDSRMVLDTYINRWIGISRDNFKFHPLWEKYWLVTFRKFTRARRTYRWGYCSDYPAHQNVRGNSEKYRQECVLSYVRGYVPEFTKIFREEHEPWRLARNTRKMRKFWWISGVEGEDAMLLLFCCWEDEVERTELWIEEGHFWRFWKP